MQSHQSEAHQRHEHNRLFNSETLSSSISSHGCVYTRPESASVGGVLRVRGFALDCRQVWLCIPSRSSSSFPRAIIHLLGWWSCEAVVRAHSWRPARTSTELQTGSLAHSPSSLLARDLGVLAVVLIRILDRGHTVDSRGPLELDAFLGGACLCRRVLLENALRGTRVGVGIAWHLQGRESLACRACC